MPKKKKSVVVEELQTQTMEEALQEEEQVVDEEQVVEEEVSEGEESEEYEQEEEVEEPQFNYEEKLYPEIECQIATRENPLTFETAKALLGWTEPKEGKEFPDPDIVMFGKTIVCQALEKAQRSITLSLVERYAISILRKHWAGMREGETPNGEPIIIGWYGHNLDGQHRLLGLCRAVELWTENPDEYPEWEEEPWLTTILVTGVCEDIRVKNTLNTGKPRSLADAIHTSGLFEGFKKRDLKKVCKAAEFAIKTLWDHTGVYHAYDPKKSHEEALDFALRHPKLLEAVKYCFAEEPGIGNNGLKTGAAACLMYIMAASKTKPTNKSNDGYWQVDAPSEKQIDFANWGKAEKFISMLGESDPKMKAVLLAISNLTDKEDGKNFGIFRTIDRNILYEKTCIVFKAWDVFLKGQPIVAKSISLKYKTDEEGEKYLAEEVILSGIDKGIHRKDEEGAEESDE